MAAARKAKEKLKSYGFSHVSLDANDSFRSDTEFSFDHMLNASSLTGRVFGSNYYSFDSDKLALTATDPYVSGMGSSDQPEFKAKLIVDEGESDPALVDKIVSEFISIS